MFPKFVECSRNVTKFQVTLHAIKAMPNSPGYPQKRFLKFKLDIFNKGFAAEVTGAFLLRAEKYMNYLNKTVLNLGKQQYIPHY